MKYYSAAVKFRAIPIRSNPTNIEWLIALVVQDQIKLTTDVIVTSGDPPNTDKEQATLKQLWIDYLANERKTHPEIEDSFK